MQTILLVLHVLVAVALIGLILLQHGKGADAGAAFGSGASSTVFGARGSTSFLTKATAVLALIFFVNSFLLAYEASRHVQPQSLVERVKTPSAPASKPAKKESSTPTGELPVAPLPVQKPQEKSPAPPAPPAGNDLPPVPDNK